jgi:hypothetical protein
VIHRTRQTSQTTTSGPVWGRELPGGFDSRLPPRGENGERSWSQVAPELPESDAVQGNETGYRTAKELGIILP